ncbi:hypothetical protein QLX08_000761 [Tetragonisca angustula]|uniref:Uncharacterized protein n=1 Tax=Tetragonisca angustula TaxID=166442 RepID=A0AAW1AHS5_9HYME
MFYEHDSDALCTVTLRHPLTTTMHRLFVLALTPVPFFFFYRTRVASAVPSIKLLTRMGVEQEIVRKGNRENASGEKDRRRSSTRKPKRRKSEKDGRPEMQHACINSVRASTRSAENCRLDAAAAIARGLSRSNGNETVQWRRKRGTRRPRCLSYLSSTRPDRVDTEHPSTPTFTIILTPLCRRSHLRDICTPYIFAPGRLNDACI